VVTTASFNAHLSFPDVDEILGELVPIMDVISASTPNPLPFEISWSFGICTPTGSKLAIPATSGNAVHNPSGSDCIGKGSLF